MNLRKTYLESIENAFELVKVAKAKDDIALSKADIYAKIALAIATSMIDVEEPSAETPVAANVNTTIPDAKEEVKVEQPKPVQNLNSKIMAIAQGKSIPLPPDHYEDETPEARKERYDHLLSKFKDVPMKELPEDIYPYLTPETNTLRAYEWLWDESHHDNSAARKEQIVKDLTEQKLNSVGDIPLSLYLEKFIPRVLDWNYFLLFEDTNEINTVLASITNNKYKDFKTLPTFAVEVWHIAAQKYIEKNFNEVEKVS